MKRVFLIFPVLALLSGCINTVYRGESFPPSASVQVLSAGEKPQQTCRIIGNARASGDFSTVSNADLQKKLKTLAMQHGAHYMVVIGTRIVPAEKVADTDNEDFLTATDDPDQLEFESAMDNYLDPPRSRETYKRIMYAVFLR